jgi:glycerol-3-phosphate O-acyltransferase
VAFFVPAAFTAMSILQKDAFQFSVSDLHREYEFLQKLFELEFVFDSETPAAYPLLQTLKTFMDEAILIPHPELPDAYNLTSAGYRKLKLFAALLKALLESYWVVLSTLAQTPYGDGQSKELSKKISARGSRMYRRKEIENREALSKVSFDNAAAFFTSRGIKGSEDQDRIAAYAAAIQRALRHLKS